MDITVGIICLFLERQYDIIESSLIRKDCSVKGFRVWNGERPRTDLLYIVENKQLKEFVQKKGKLCIGIRYEDTADMHGCCGISVNDSIELYQLINVLQEIFQEFYEWRMHIERLFYTHAAFEEILDEIERTYGLISVLVDKNLQYIAFSDSYKTYNEWVGDEKIMSLEVVSDLMDDENFRTAIQHDKAFCYYRLDKKKYSYCYNIKVRGEYEARFLIQNKMGSLFAGGLSLAGYIGENIAEMFVYYEQERTQERVLYDFYEIMKELLQGLPKSPEEIRRKLSVRGWEKDHMYQVYQFQFMEENASVTRRYYQSKIEDLFHDCCVLEENERVCCIWNLSVTNQKNWEVHQKLSVFLRDNLCRAGISHKFTDISLLHRYYLEAQYALDLGLQSESTSWDYPFETMILPFFRSQATRELGPGQLYHPGIRTLMEYDKREHTELVKTVKEYMKCRYNVTETARALFVHRTTVLFRLQRVEKLTGINWDDWQERLWIGITLGLLKEN